jgi:hypothetical protein
MQRAMGLIKKGPDVSQAATVGEPTLVESEPVAPSLIIQGEFADSGPGKNSIGPEILNGKQPAADNAPPIPNPLTPPGSNPSNAGPPAPDPNELKPNAPADPNELKPVDAGTDNALPPPAQVNEISQGQSSSIAAKADDNSPASDQDISSSKRKKKKGLSKINPF